MVLAALLLVGLVIPVVGQLASPQVVVALGSDSGHVHGTCWGDFYNSDADYGTSHDSALGSRKASSVPANFEIGQKASSHYIYRWASFFYTDSYKDVYGTVNVTAASLWVDAYTDVSVTDFDLTVVDASGGTDACTGISPFTCDYSMGKDDPNYGYLHNMVTSLGSINTAAMSYGDHWNEIVLNATGLQMIEDAINNEENARIGLRASNDISATEPPGNSYITIDVGSSYSPYIDFDFEYGTVPTPPDPGCTTWENQTIYNPDEYGYDAICDSVWVGETIVPTETHDISAMLLTLYRIGSPTDLFVYVYLADDVTWYPTGGPLASATVDVSTLTTEVYGEWVTVVLSNSVTLTLGNAYDIILKGADECGMGNDIAWLTQDYSVSEYLGYYMNTYDMVDWYWPTRDGLFVLYDCPSGTAVALYQTWGYVPSTKPAWYQAWPSILKILWLGAVILATIFVYRQKPRPQYPDMPDMPDMPDTPSMTG